MYFPLGKIAEYVAVDRTFLQIEPFYYTRRTRNMGWCKSFAHGLLNCLGYRILVKGNLSS